MVKWKFLKKIATEGDKSAKRFIINFYKCIRRKIRYSSFHNKQELRRFKAKPKKNKDFLSAASESSAITAGFCCSVARAAVFVHVRFSCRGSTLSGRREGAGAFPTMMKRRDGRWEAQQPDGINDRGLCQLVCGGELCFEVRRFWIGTMAGNWREKWRLCENCICAGALRIHFEADRVRHFFR